MIENDQDSNPGWFKAMRGNDAMEVLASNPLAYVLAAVIAHRANWRGGFNRLGLAQGEALLGDHCRYGMSQQQYRTAKDHLSKWGFATFKSTSRGTVGKLMDSRLFTVCRVDGNEPINKQPTNGQRAANEQPTTNEELKNIRTKEGEGGAHAPEAQIPSWQEWWGYVQMHHPMPEWKAREGFDKCEEQGWEGIRSWQARIRRLFGWWQRDGSPMQPAQRSQGLADGKPKSVFELKTILEAKKTEADQIRNAHYSQAALGGSWDSVEHRKAYFALKNDIKQLNSKIARIA